MSAKLKLGMENFAKERNFMKKNLAKVVTLGLLTASVFMVNGFGQAWAKETIDNKDVKLEDKHGVWPDTYYNDRKVDVTVTKETKDGLTDVNVMHTGDSTHSGNDTPGESTTACRESSQSITIGQIATMNDAYMANDKALQQQINDIKKNGTGDDLHLNSGKLNGNNLELKVVDKNGKDKIDVIINNIARANDLTKETEDRKDADANRDVRQVKYTEEDGTLTFINEKNNEITHVDGIASKAKLDDEVTARKEADERIEQKFNGEVSRLDSRIDKLDGRVEKVGAMAAAMASLHTMGYDPAAPTEIAVGVGQYRDKTGFALGAFHYPNKNFMLNVSVSTAGDEFMAGIGATWKIGRRSPEAMLKAEQEKAARQALAKAEAEKKAAKDARVAAQAARHAKMLAERGL